MDETPTFKIILIGESAVGKTAMIFQYLAGTFLDHTPNTGVANHYKRIELPNGF